MTGAICTETPGCPATRHATTCPGPAPVAATLPERVAALLAHLDTVEGAPRPVTFDGTPFPVSLSADTIRAMLAPPGAEAPPAEDTPNPFVALLDAVEVGTDREAAAARADELVLQAAPPDVRDAYHRFAVRAGWAAP